MISLDPTALEYIYKTAHASKQLGALFDFYLKRLCAGEPPASEKETYAHLTKTSVDVVIAKKGEGSLDDAKARNANRRLRETLSAFNNTPVGRKLPFRLEVPKSKYALEYQSQSPSLKRFWKPYIELDDEKQVEARIIYTEHQFFGHRTEDYIVRHRSANRPDDDINALMPFLPALRQDLIPTRQFVNAGEVQALLRLNAWFGSLLIPTEHIPGHIPKLRKSVAGKNIVVLGNPRSCRFIERLQLKLDFTFQCQADGIHVSNPDETKPAFYPTPYKSREKLYGIVTRVFHQKLGSWVTAIISTHGRFSSAMAYNLTHDVEVAEFMRELGIDDSKPMPNQFEALIAIVPTEDDDSEMVGHELEVVDSRILPERGR